MTKDISTAKSKSGLVSQFTEELSITDVLAWFATNSVILIGVILFTFPVYYMIISTSFTMSQFYVYPPKLLPGNNLIQNFQFLFTETHFLQTLLNTIIYASTVTVGSIILATFTGYAFSMFVFRGRKPLFALIIAMLSVPFQLIAIPLFKLLADYQMVNSYVGGILPVLVFPVVLLMIKQNFDQLDLADLLNSARIDGASEFQIFYHIALPLMRPAIAAAAIVGFMLKAGGLFWPLIVFRDPKMHTVTIFISQQVGLQTTTNWTVMMTAASLLTVPLLAVIIYFQKYFIKGMLSGSYK